MFNIVLYQPEIPPNTGSIMRLCVNTGCKLHLIKPLGFTLDNKQLKRAGLDYKAKSVFTIYEDFGEYLATVKDKTRMFFCSTKSSSIYSETNFATGDSLIFGPETRGLPIELMEQYPNSQRIRIPMTKDGRSLNLAISASIITYKAWEKIGFTGGR